MPEKGRIHWRSSDLFFCSFLNWMMKKIRMSNEYRICEVAFWGDRKHQTIWGRVKPTPEQIAMASLLGLQVNPDDTFSRVAAAILEKVGGAIGYPPRNVTARQHELAEEWDIDISDCKSSWAAFVKIQEALQLCDIAAVERMQLQTGDTVVNSADSFDEEIGSLLDRANESFRLREYVVSSVSPDGHVTFDDGTRAPARHLAKQEDGAP